ncbi:hypothetical protein TMEN_1487, partial [Trichophyton mentagrophytes]
TKLGITKVKKVIFIGFYLRNTAAIWFKLILEN